MRGAYVLAIGVAVGGCPADDDTDVDAAPAGALRIDVTGDRTLPADITTSPLRHLERVRLHARTIRAFGDAAPGDARTTAMDVDLLWDRETVPAATAFDQAPSALYASVEIRLERDPAGGEHVVELRGTAETDPDGGGPVPFGSYEYEIELEEIRCTITVPTQTPLDVGQVASIPIAVVLGHAIEALDFSQLAWDGEKLKLPEASPLEATIADWVRESFTGSTGVCDADR
jgi:hypothetical protein